VPLDDRKADSGDGIPSATTSPRHGKRRYTLPSPSGKGWGQLRDEGLSYAVRYRRGAIVQHRTWCRMNNPGGAEDQERAIKDMSAKARRRAAFALGNAECEWVGMTTLTWHVQHPDGAEVKKCLAKLSRALRKRGDPLEAWGMEMQGRDTPHYHLFHSDRSAIGQAIRDGEKETTVEKGKDRIVSRTHSARWLEHTWLEITGQLDDVDARYFTRRGLCEPMRHGDAAGRYLSKVDREIGKRCQKLLPEWYTENGLGRWWYLRSDLRPVARSAGWVSLDDWPWKDPYVHVWDAESLPWESEVPVKHRRVTGNEPLTIIRREPDRLASSGTHIPAALLPTDSETADDLADFAAIAESDQRAYFVAK